VAEDDGLGDFKFNSRWTRPTTIREPIRWSHAGSAQQVIFETWFWGVGSSGGSPPVTGSALYIPSRMMMGMGI
jgi:hypothetical protein